MAKRKNRASGEITVTFWGVRGSIATCWEKTRRYGGSTPCVSLRYRNQWFICDAGTGIHLLGKRLVRNKDRVALFFSHLHWDHIFGLPFFDPLYQRGRNITLAGPTYQGRSFKETFQKVMHPPYFPVGPSIWSSRIKWSNLRDGGRFKFGRVDVEAREVFHRGKTYGFQFHFPGGKRVAYVTDHELYGDRDKFGPWIRGVDLLIHDSTYNRKEYVTHRDWGHSAFEEVVELAIRERVKKLVLFHHHPDVPDRELEGRLERCRQIVRRHRSLLQCLLAREGMTIRLR